MLIAEIVFWGDDRGGRYCPPSSGFKPQILVGGIQTSCIVTSLAKKDMVFKFDEPYIVTLDLMFPDEYEEELMKSEEIILFEGRKQIAKGKHIKEHPQKTNKI